MKKALIVSPYLDHLGGGERYMLSISAILESLGYDIYFAWDNLEQIANLSAMLGLNLRAPHLDPKVKELYFKGNALSMYLSTRSYDVVIYLSDGSIPLLGGKRNILHMQVPFHGVGGQSLPNRIKQLFIHSVVVNSEFTKQIVDQEYKIDSRVLYPPVPSINSHSKKENIILSVGRFEPSLNTKHQDVMIEAFKSLSSHLSNWRLVLVGGSSSEEWLNKLKASAKGYSIEIIENIPHDQLLDLYGRATIYWHAAGYGVDELKNPELTEHFGISTVEALSAGCVPLVVPFGGQKEIVSDPTYHWKSTEELVKKTLSTIANPVLPKIDVSKYSLENFRINLEKIIK